MGAKPCCASQISVIGQMNLQHLDTQLIHHPSQSKSIKEPKIDISVQKTKEKPIPIQIIQSKQPDDDYCFQVIMNLYETIQGHEFMVKSIIKNDFKTNQDHYDTYTNQSHKQRKYNQSIDILFRQRSCSHHDQKTRSLTTRITQESKLNVNTVFTVNIKGILKRHQDDDNYLTSKGKSVHFKDHHHHKHLKSHTTKRRDSYK